RLYKYIFLVVIAVSTAFRFINAEDGMVLYFHSLSVMSDLAIGGLGAYLALSHEGIKKFFRGLSPFWIMVIYAAGSVLLFTHSAQQFPHDYPLLVAGERLGWGLLFLFAILEQNYGERSLVKLSWCRWLTELGKYTYGIYMLHPLGIQSCSVALRL